MHKGIVLETVRHTTGHATLTVLWAHENDLRRAAELLERTVRERARLGRPATQGKTERLKSRIEGMKPIAVAERVGGGGFPARAATRFLRKMGKLRARLDARQARPKEEEFAKIARVARVVLKPDVPIPHVGAVISTPPAGRVIPLKTLKELLARKGR